MMLTTILVSAAVAFAVSEIVNRVRFVEIDRYVEQVVRKLKEITGETER